MKMLGTLKKYDSSRGRAGCFEGKPPDRLRNTMGSFDNIAVNMIGGMRSSRQRNFRCHAGNVLKLRGWQQHGELVPGDQEVVGELDLV